MLNETAVSLRYFKITAVNLLSDTKLSSPQCTNGKSSVIEGLAIIPTPWHLHTLTSFIDRIGRNITHDKCLTDYIQLTRFIQSNGPLRIGCDWCAIVNGTMEFVLATIKNNTAKNILKLDNLTFSIIYRMLVSLQYIPNSVVTAEYKVSTGLAIKFIHDNNITYALGEYSDLIAFIQKLLNFRAVVAQIESRWCPFAYIAKLEYSRPYWDTDLKPITKMLRERGNAICTDCINDINLEFVIINVIPSLFQSYLDKLINLSKDTTKKMNEEKQFTDIGILLYIRQQRK
jgi:hypothetical protein